MTEYKEPTFFRHPLRILEAGFLGFFILAFYSIIYAQKQHVIGSDQKFSEYCQQNMCEDIIILNEVSFNSAFVQERHFNYGPLDIPPSIFAEMTTLNKYELQYVSGMYNIKSLAFPLDVEKESKIYDMRRLDKLRNLTLWTQAPYASQTSQIIKINEYLTSVSTESMDKYHKFFFWFNHPVNITYINEYERQEMIARYPNVSLAERPCIRAH